MTAGLTVVLFALVASGAAGRTATSSPDVLAKALLAAPLHDARLSAFGGASVVAGRWPGAVGGVKITFTPSGASILYGVATWPDDINDSPARVGSIQTTRRGPKWLPGQSAVVTSSGFGPKGWITEVLFEDGAVGMLAVNPSSSTPGSRDVDSALVLARVALDHLRSIEHSIGWHAISFVNAFGVPSSSMEPTLHCARPAQGCLAAASDHVRAKPFGHASPKRGDILVFKTPPKAALVCGAGGTFIKRLIGLPGETIQEKLIGGKGYVFINGGRLDESYVTPDRRDSMTYGPYKIPKGDYFVMGDNRVQSCDSREWGPVPLKNIVGRVVLIFRGSKRIPVP